MSKFSQNISIALYLWGIVFSGILFHSCDTIKEGEYLIPLELPEAKKKVLIEDYTGMKCPNCPNAADMINLLKKSYGENIIAVSIHAGIYAKPSGIFVNDFRTEAGTTYNSTFFIEAYPTGLINRTTYNNKIKLDYQEWNGAVQSLISQDSPIGIKIVNQWSETDRSVKSNIDISIFKDMTEELKLQVWLVEDSIVAPQVSGSVILNEYIHKHVLRGALNGTWGEDLNGASKNIVLTKTLIHQLPDWVDAAQCSIIAFVYRRIDKSVVQVNETKLTY